MGGQFGPDRGGQFAPARGWSLCSDLRWSFWPFFPQPALDKKKAKVNNLYLLAAPINNDDFHEINIDYVFDFLGSLYKSLGIKKPELDFDYKLMAISLHQQKKINNCINLKQINV